MCRSSEKGERYERNEPRDGHFRPCPIEGEAHRGADGQERCQRQHWQAVEDVDSRAIHVFVERTNRKKRPETCVSSRLVGM